MGVGVETISVITIDGRHLVVSSKRVGRSERAVFDGPGRLRGLYEGLISSPISS